MMAARSLLAEQVERAERAEEALERVLAVAEVMDGSSSVYVRTAAATIRTVVAQPVKDQRS